MYRYFIYCRKSSEDDDRQMLSLESQQLELGRYAVAHSLLIVEILVESKSARLPGRPVFTEMMKRIGRGEANGILSWHPNRLARNAVDGGQIIHYLDRGKLLDLRFPTFTFENSPQGKFMLMIMFGHSKYEVDSLSEHVKRGNRMKRELGWFPGRPPLGYLNVRSDSGARVIGRDPERFPAIKKIWELFLTGNYSGPQLLFTARDLLKLRTRQSGRSVGHPVGQTVLYRILRSSFYTGNLVHQDRWFPGSHEPMISVSEFNRAQQLLRGLRIRPRRYRFAYSGFMKCGNCGASVTAEKKVKKTGKTYIYYHCTHGRPGLPCREPVIEERELERQIVAFFAGTVASETALQNQQSIRFILANRASGATLKGKVIAITLKNVK